MVFLITSGVLGFLSFLMGAWGVPNAKERDSKWIRVLSLIIFVPIGVCLGIAMTFCLQERGIPIDSLFGIIPVALGLLSAKKIDELLARYDSGDEKAN